MAAVQQQQQQKVKRKLTTKTKCEGVACPLESVPCVDAAKTNKKSGGQPKTTKKGGGQPKRKAKAKGKPKAKAKAKATGKANTTGPKVKKQATHRTKTRKTGAARRQRSKGSSKRQLDFVIWGLVDDLDDSDDDGPPGLLEESVAGDDSADESLIDELNLAFLSDLDDMSDAGGAASESGDDADDPPLLEILRMMVHRLPQALFLQLCLNWKLLSDISHRHPLGAGSGCSGSGLDWMTLVMLSEVSTLSLARVV